MDNASGIGLLPWETDPYKLISWWDMEEFSAAQFYNIAELFDKFVHDLFEGYEYRGPHDFEKTIDEETISNLEKTLLCPIEEECQKIALCYSADAISQFRTDLRSMTFSVAKTRVEEIDRSIRREMKLHLFMYIPADRAEYYKPWGESKRKERGKEGPLFGNSVKSKFPSTDYDITETGNCFASGRYTACAFHLMRVLEIGLCLLAKTFSVNSDHSNWQTIIDQIEVKIKDIGKNQKKPTNWKEDEEFYSQAISYLTIVKNAWRNYTMHVRAKYTEEESELMIKNVRAFMQTLSKRLSEESEE